MLPKLRKLRTKTHSDGSVSYWFDRGGKPRRWENLGKDERKALEKYQRLIGESAPAMGTVGQMLADCIADLESRRAVKPATLENYRIYKRHLEAVFSDPPEVTQAEVLKYLRLCPRMSFRNEISLLSIAYAHWMENGRLTFNPCFGVHIRRKTSKRTRLVSARELEAIIGKADERLSVAIELAYATGLRIGDLCRLRWTDLDGVIRTQKTGEKVEIEHSDALEVIVARAKALQARVGSLYVLCSNARGRAWKPDHLRRRWRVAMADAGVTDARWHDIRAMAATEVARLYGDEAARVFLAHTDVRTTLAYIRARKAVTIKPLERKKA